MTIASPSDGGLYASSGNVTIKGGTVKVTGAYGSAIAADSSTYRGKTYGGKVKISGGKVTAKVRTLNGSGANFAISAGVSVSNKPGTLKSIKGRLGKGARFKSGGNTYKVMSSGDTVMLATYGSSKTKATLKKAKAGGVTYRIVGVGANAFNTKRGKLVKSIAFKSDYPVTYLGKNAFRNTTSLTSLEINLGINTSYQNGRYKVSAWDGTTFAKTAFSGAGKDGGRGLTVYYHSYGQDFASAYKGFLTRKGLSPNARVAYRES